jgi:putative ABC transport system ATP-binding protein
MSEPKWETRERVFSARGLTKIYHAGTQEIHALRGLDLDLDSGELVVLLGPSGSGKSTLLNILGGLDNASGGAVFYRDHDLVRTSSSELTQFRRDHVGFVFQFYNLIPSLTALENIRLVTEIVESTGKRPLAPREALSWVGLADRADAFPSELSGGEQQRVAIARAVAKSPDILLCDEPTGALDFETAKLVLESILRVNRALGTLVVVITHNAAIAGLADRVLRLADGQIRSETLNRRRLSIEDIEW